MYTIEYSKQSLKSLAVVPANTARLIQSKIVQLAADPFAQNNNVKKLEGHPGYRLRVGAWRVIYELQETRNVIYVLAIVPRGGINK